MWRFWYLVDGALRMAALLAPPLVTAGALLLAQAPLASPITWVAMALAVAVGGGNTYITSERVLDRSTHIRPDPTFVGRLEDGTETTLHAASDAVYWTELARSAFREGDVREAERALQFSADHTKRTKYLIARLLEDVGWSGTLRLEFRHRRLEAWRRYVHISERYVVLSLLMLTAIAFIVCYYATSGVIGQVQQKSFTPTDTVQAITAVAALVAATTTGVAAILRAYAHVMRARADVLRARLGLPPSESNTTEGSEPVSGANP